VVAITGLVLLRGHHGSPAAAACWREPSSRTPWRSPSAPCIPAAAPPTRHRRKSPSPVIPGHRIGILAPHEALSWKRKTGVRTTWKDHPDAYANPVPRGTGFAFTATAPPPHRKGKKPRGR
jgi:hypothetical protein